MYAYSLCFECPMLNLVAAVTAFASIWTPRNRKDIDDSGAGEADLRQQEYATDGVGAERQ